MNNDNPNIPTDFEDVPEEYHWIVEMNRARQEVFDRIEAARREGPRWRDWREQEYPETSENR